MNVSSLVRPELLARAPATWLIAVSVAMTSGVLVGRAIVNAPRVEHIAVASAPPEVTVHVPQSAPPVVELPVAVPAPEPPVAAVPALRPLAPHLYAECIGLDFAAEIPAVCNWDNGFPAVSADAQLVATAESPDDGGRGYPGLSIQFLDANTGKLVRTILVLSPDEYVEPDDKNAKDVSRMRKRIAARVATAQRALDDGGYRTMVALGHDETEAVDGDTPVTHDAIYAEISGDSARIIDPATQRVIWQHTFSAAAPKAAPDADCSGWNLGGMSMWWDPTTRITLASQWYTTGGCMCGSFERVHVARVPHPK